MSIITCSLTLLCSFPFSAYAAENSNYKDAQTQSVVVPNGGTDIRSVSTLISSNTVYRRFVGYHPASTYWVTIPSAKPYFEVTKSVTVGSSISYTQNAVTVSFDISTSSGITSPVDASKVIGSEARVGVFVDVDICTYRVDNILVATGQVISTSYYTSYTPRNNTVALDAVKRYSSITTVSGASEVLGDGVGLY